MEETDTWWLDGAERQQTKKRLRESEEFNRRVLASSADCIKVLDLDARLEFMSEGGMCVMEVEDFGAIRGACWPDFWTNEGHAKALAAVDAAKRGGTGRFQGFATTMKGTPRWWDVIVSPINGADGRPEKLLSVSRDVTATKLAEERLLESEERFRALATVGTSAIYQMSADWREMRVLEGAGFIVDTEKPTADWVETYIPVDEQPRVRGAIDRAIAAKDAFELEHRVLRADGTVGWTFSRAIPLLDGVGEIVEWFGAAIDVTARVVRDQSFNRLFSASPTPFLVLAPDPLCFGLQN